MKRFRDWSDFAIQFVKTHKIISLVVIIALVVILFILKPGREAPITTEKVRRENISQTISITGSVDSSSTANLNFRVSGKLVYLGAKKGDYVYANQTIGALDERTVQKNLEIALIDYSKQRLTFDQALEKNQNRKPQEALNNDMKRILENNQFDLDRAVKSVELSDLAKQDSVLTTPISGIITRTDVETSGVNVSATTTFTVTDLSSLAFKIDVDQTDIGKVKNGQIVKVILDSYPDETLKLTVDRIDFVSHTTSTGGDAFTVSAKLPIPPDYNDYKYRVGINGNAEIITEERKDVLTIPVSSTTEDNKVFIKTKNGYEEKKIKTGILSDTRIEVLNGLSQNDEVVVEPTLISKKTQGIFTFRFFGR